MANSKTIDELTISYKCNVVNGSVLPEEIRLVQAHLGDLLLKVLMQSEED